jgi:hypothetical protein
MDLRRRSFGLGSKASIAAVIGAFAAEMASRFSVSCRIMVALCSAAP